MNIRCEICDAVLPEDALDKAKAGHCPECGARSAFAAPTSEAPRPPKDANGAKGAVTEVEHEWVIDPDGPILR